MGSQVVVDGLGHIFKTPTARDVVALNDVSLDIGPRDFVAILGPSAAIIAQGMRVQ